MSEDLSKIRVLLVDDEPFVLNLLKQQLYNLGFKNIITSQRADEALSLIGDNSNEPIELIFSDLQMPGMDGIEFMRNLAYSNFTGGFVLISGEEERVIQTANKLANAHQINVLGVLQKPVPPNKLHDLLVNYSASANKKTTQPTFKIYTTEELKSALINKELVNYYQPKVNMTNGKVIGVETLVRWQHPKDGLVFPDQFICTAEQDGLIDDLTAQVLDMSLHQARSWQQSGMNLVMSVNVSMDNLTVLDFPDLVEKAIKATGIPANNLILEVTESRLMKNPLAQLDILTRLRLKRISLSIDDFGTGHSSLAQLRDIPFDELKIDRSFVHGSSQDASLRSILESSLAMAKQLGIRTVAEGIEDQNDWDFLRKCDCDIAQGYFIGKPMPGNKLPEWISDWESHWLEIT